MALLFGKKKKKKDPAPAPEPIPLDYKTPKKDIKFVQTFTQANGFKGFRRVSISTGTSDVVWNNIEYFRDNGCDLTNSAVQLLVIRSDMEPGVQIKVLVDGRFIGNIYRYKTNAEAFDAVIDKNVDKVFVKIEDTVIDGKYYGTQAFLMLHWPNMGPKINVKVE
jgi:hypothetical protein